MEKFYFEETIKDSGSVVVSVEVGQVQVRSHERPVVLVEGQARHMQLAVDGDGGQVEVAARLEKGGAASMLDWLTTRKRPRLEMTVYVPANCRVELATTTGQASLQGLSGPIKAEVTTGELQLADLGGDIDALVVTGRLGYQGALAGESHRFVATTGSVRLRLSETPDVQLDARATTGSVQCDFELAKARRQSHLVGSTLSGRLGAGAGRLDAHVVTGTVHLQPVSG